jgi:hypothetical protein
MRFTDCRSSRFESNSCDVISATIECASENTRQRSAAVAATLAAAGVIVLVVLRGATLRSSGMAPNPLINAPANGGITRVELQPIPEGPTLLLERVPTAQGPRGSRQLGLIKEYIPEPLPAPLGQGRCNLGGDLVVTLGNGKQVVYGPCHRPASVNHPWAEMVSAASNGMCIPTCEP